MGKFKASRIIVSESWNVLKQDKEMILFPLLSMLFSLAPIILFFVYYFFAVLKGSFLNFSGFDKSAGDYVILVYLIYGASMIFLINFFEAGVFAMAHARFNGQNMTFKEALQVSFKNTGKILVWSLFSATLGFVLNMISDRSKIVGKIFSWLFGAAWNIMTYFVLPSIIVSQNSIKDALKDSSSVIRKNWGETIIINFGVGMFLGILIYICIVLGFMLVAFIPQLMIITLPLVIAFLIGISVVSSTLGSIFKLALYEYAKTGAVPQGFSSEVVIGAIKGSNTVSDTKLTI